MDEQIVSLEEDAESSERIPGVVWLDGMGVLFLALGRASTLIATVAIPVCSPTNHEKVSLFPSTLFNIGCYYFYL